MTIYQAAADNNLEALKQQLHLLHVPDANGKTALQHAREQNASHAIELLLQYGAEEPPEEIRVPLDEKYEVLVLATYLLTRLGDPVGVQEFQGLLSHADYRVEKMARQYQKGYGGLHHDHGQPQEPHDQETLAIIQHLLRHGRLGLRELGLEWAVEEPDQRLAPDILPNLSGRSEELLPLASRAFRMCCTHDQQTLDGIRPLMEMVIPPLPDDGTPELVKKNKARAKKEYDVRRYAAQALMYPHGSRSIQDYLLAYQADPNRKLKRELNIVFQYCPDPQALQQHLQSLIETQPDPLRTHAVFALSHFRNPDHKPLFLSLLQSSSVGTAEGALRGLQPHISQADLPALQECRDRWK